MWVQIRPCERAILRGRVAHCKVLGLSAASCATRAQQLLRWATVDHSRHGPECGVLCPLIGIVYTWLAWNVSGIWKAFFLEKRNENPAGALVPAFRVIRVARFLTGGARYDLDHLRPLGSIQYTTLLHGSCLRPENTGVQNHRSRIRYLSKKIANFKNFPKLKNS